MNPQEFDTLSINDKADLVWEQGEFIADRYYYNQILGLWAMKGFYVEMFYSQDENRITKIERVTDEKVLERYIDEMDIDLKNL